MCSLQLVFGRVEPGFDVAGQVGAEGAPLAQHVHLLSGDGQVGDLRVLGGQPGTRALSLDIIQGPFCTAGAAV